MSKVRLKLREAIENYISKFPEGERPNHLKIAVEMDISPNTLSRYINNRVQQTDLVVISKLCDYLGIRDFNDLFELVDTEEQSE